MTVEPHRARPSYAFATRRSPRTAASGSNELFGVDTSWTGIDLCDPNSPLRLERDPSDPLDTVPTDAVAVTARVGVAYAGEDWAAQPWRFAISGHRSVSGPASARRAAGDRRSARSRA